MEFFLLGDHVFFFFFFFFFYIIYFTIAYSSTFFFEISHTAQTILMIFFLTELSLQTRIVLKWLKNEFSPFIIKDFGKNAVGTGALTSHGNIATMFVVNRIFFIFI